MLINGNSEFGAEWNRQTFTQLSTWINELYVPSSKRDEWFKLTPIINCCNIILKKYMEERKYLEDISYGAVAFSNNKLLYTPGTKKSDENPHNSNSVQSSKSLSSLIKKVIYKTETEYIIKLELSDVEMSDIAVECNLEEETNTFCCKINGTKTKKDTERNITPIAESRAFGAFEEIFNIPIGYELEEPSANLDKGVLKLSWKKRTIKKLKTLQVKDQIVENNSNLTKKL